MPRAKIVVANPKNHRLTLDNLVREGVVKRIQCKGAFIYGREYLTNQQIKKAYLRKINEEL